MDVENDLKAQLSGWKIQPPKNPNACMLCGVVHVKGMPHNKDSVQYQYNFAKEHGRWPTWSDASKHCTEEVRTMVKNLVISKGLNFE